MLPKLLVFDLDGTLIDSRIDLCNSVNATLNHYGRAQLSEEVISGYIGDGATTLVRRALAHVHLIANEPDPHDDAFIEEALDWFIGYYKVHKLDYTYVYPGAMEALAAIRERHPQVLMAVLTNKPVDPSRAICEHFGLDRYFFQNYGGNSFQTKKPNPEGLLQLIAEASAIAGKTLTPADTVMIGDSSFDILTAKNCGARSLGCTFGLAPQTLPSSHPDAVVDRASDWPAALGLN
ncbi:HAD family hydrolase [Granulicella sp. WH15]|uniref:HAD family hydrolase n=1 Tax=Granulicella sp. WH15 TaxID=2602070 RepID=UPI001366B1E3|nr:HAD hydrolase-like protein [Granulicella sp. WH15]QHN03929.1 HAD family hydrolase [Granulicella sp. WH15]